MRFISFPILKFSRLNRRWLFALILQLGLLWIVPVVQADAGDNVNEIDLSICNIRTSTPQKLTNEPFDLIVCVQQAGPRDVLNTQVVVELPIGIEFLAGRYTKNIPEGRGDCRFAPNPTSKNLAGVVRCESAPLNSGGIMYVTLNLLAHEPKSYTFRAQTSGDPWLYDSPANNTGESQPFTVIQRRKTEVVVDEFSVFVETITLQDHLPQRVEGGVQVRLQFVTRREVEVASFRVLRRDITLGEALYTEIADLSPRGQNDAGANYFYWDGEVAVDHVYGYRLVVIGYDNVARITPERKITIDILRRFYLPVVIQKYTTHGP